MFEKLTCAILSTGAEEGDTEVEAEPKRPRGRKPAARKAVTEVPEREPAARTSTAAKAVTEAPRAPEEPADTAAVQVHPSTYFASTSLTRIHVRDNERDA